MNYFNKLILTILMTLLGTTGYAALDMEAVTAMPSGESLETSILPEFPEPAAIKLDGIYRFTEDDEMLPLQAVLNGEVEDNFNEYVVEMTEGEPVVVEYLPSGLILISLSLHESEQGVFPEQFVITYDELEALHLDYESGGTIEDLWSTDAGLCEVQVASRNSQRVKARKHRVRNTFSRDKNGRIVGRGGNCVAVVKHLTGFVGTAGNGKGFANALLNWHGRGYKKVGLNHRKKGTVCSWNGGWHGKGHVGWFDGHCFQPTYNGNCGHPGKRYRMSLCVSN